ncbi:hypothetical protein EVAR_68310_1 [Eumeta japonica]|uniref:Uncharacterized protein n=1 Tax=Eumeta variegata TaxID=151549 RepID=A0A4C2ADN8_EUMVA|nr:hypothetical protein EVAR_68310_1 [Eumeta japonica]
MGYCNVQKPPSWLDCSDERFSESDYGDGSLNFEVWYIPSDISLSTLSSAFYSLRFFYDIRSVESGNQFCRLPRMSVFESVTPHQVSISKIRSRTSMLIGMAFLTLWCLLVNIPCVNEGFSKCFQDSEDLDSVCEERGAQVRRGVRRYPGKPK